MKSSSNDFRAVITCNCWQLSRYYQVDAIISPPFNFVLWANRMQFFINQRVLIQASSMISCTFELY